MSPISTETPILDALIRQAGATQAALHVPGHKSGRLLPTALSTWLAAAARLDATELPGLDNLHAPQGCILASQRLAAALYGSDVCHYSVNGSTAGVMAALAAAAGPQDEVLLVGRFHLSAWRGLVLSGALPRLVPSEFAVDRWLFQHPSLAAVAAAIARAPAVKAALLTSPTYEGRIADVRAYVDLLHRHDIAVIVDEAHGAHLGLHPSLPDHSVGQGADVVVQSVHKMLPGLTQTAWVHCQGGRVDPDAVARWLRFLQTTSPSYLLLASIDAARAWLASAGRDALTAGIRNIRRHAVGWPELMRLDPAHDPYKTWVPTGSAGQSERLARMLASHGMVPETVDGFGLLAIHALDAPERELTRFSRIVNDWHAAYDGPTADMAQLLQLMLAWPLAQPAVSPRAAELAPKRSVPWSASAGETLGALLAPYPPGVPLAWPGQRVDGHLLEMIARCRQLGMEIHGVTPDDRMLVLA